jgi:hypothetical protein
MLLPSRFERTQTTRPRATGHRRTPGSGSTALAASAFTQAAMGIEFTLSGMNKVADPRYVANFDAFVRSNPGSRSGVLAPLVHLIVLPHLSLFATVILGSELAIGMTLLLGAVEVARRRFSGRLGAEHNYEAVVALLAALAALGGAALTLSIFMLMGGVFPTVMPDRAFTTAIPVELLLVPIGLSLAWMEFGRWRVL